MKIMVLKLKGYIKLSVIRIRANLIKYFIKIYSLSLILVYNKINPLY